ncbi:MAG: GGDEF domain-containing protein [Spirochaetota bacterium]
MFIEKYRGGNVRKPEKERARLFSALWETTLDPMWICRLLPGNDYEFTDISKACSLLLPGLRRGLLMSELLALSPTDPATALAPALRQCVATGKAADALLHVDGKTGRKTLKIEIIPVPHAALDSTKGSSATSHQYLMGIGYDLEIAYAELLKQNDELRKAGERYLDLALTDSLTGLANRRCFQDVADKEFERARRYGRELTLILLDMDNLKRVNDEQGHQAGDAALKAIAVALSGASRATDTVARIGGDEFALILPETSCADGIVIAGRARSATAKGYRTLDGKKAALSMSAGAAGIIHTDAAFDTIFIRADRALYRAKNTGKNRTEADCPDLHDRSKGSTLN